MKRIFAMLLVLVMVLALAPTAAFAEAALGDIKVVSGSAAPGGAPAGTAWVPYTGSSVTDCNHNPDGTALTCCGVDMAVCTESDHTAHTAAPYLSVTAGDPPVTTCYKCAHTHTLQGKEGDSICLPDGYSAWQLVTSYSYAVSYSYENAPASATAPAAATVTGTETTLSHTLPAAPAAVTDEVTGDVYSFLGWYIGETKYEGGASVSVSSDTTVVGKWEKKEGKTIVVTANITGLPDDASYTDSSLKIVLEGPNGYSKTVNGPLGNEGGKPGFSAAVPQGSYTATLTVGSVSGYEFSSAPVSFTVDANTADKQVFTVSGAFAAKTYDLTVKVVDQDGAAVSGAVVKIAKSSGSPVETPTNASGEVKFESLAWNASTANTISQVSAPAGYTAASGSASILLAADGTFSVNGTLPTGFSLSGSTLTIVNTAATADLVIKPVESGIPSGAESFAATSYTYLVKLNGGTANGGSEQTVTVTDMAVGATVSGLKAGTSYEIVPQPGTDDIWTASSVTGTIAPAAGETKVEASVTHTYKSAVEGKTFTITVVDAATNKGIPGVKINAYSDAACTSLILEAGTTDANGQLVVSAEGSGTVYFKQAAVPSPYALSSDVITLTGTGAYELRGDTITYVVSISPASGTMKNNVMKVNLTVKLAWYGDKNKTRPESVEVYLYRDGVVCGSATVKASDNWTYTWYGLTAGSYSVAEKTPEGYVWWVTADANTNTFTIHNNGGTPKTGDESMVGMYSLLCLLTATGAGVIAYTLRKKEDEA